MKNYLFIIPVLLSASALAQTGTIKRGVNIDSFLKVQNEKRNALIGKPYPAFTVTSNGHEYSNETIKGKVALVNFWFSACVPCIAEFDDLNRIYEQFKDDKRFEMLAFTFDGQPVIDSIRTKYKLAYKIIPVSRDECRRLNLLGGYPANTIIDQAGNTRLVSYIGEVNFKTGFTAMISSLLGK